ncbi:MAG: ATP-binding protein [Carboxylicivirga sp.]|nr:ATP-binding protein [Carboxylicivirga sp.]
MKKLSLIVIFLLSLNLGFGQHSPMRFQSITINDGLSLSSVYCINKDSKGFMWFGTEDGLNRYDGYQFKIYRTDVKNPNSICYKWIEHIEEDELGNLWFGSRNGLSHFNPQNEQFITFREDEQQKLLNDTITNIETFNRQVYIGTKDGLSIFDAQTLEASHFTQLEAVNKLLAFNNTMLVATSTGLYQLKGVDSIDQMLDFEVVDICVDGDVIYAASDNSIVKIDFHTTVSVESFPIDKINGIESIAFDTSGRLWINSKDGLWVLFIKKGKAKKLIHTANSTNSLAVDSRKSLWISPEGMVWYATHGDGLFVIDRQFQVTKCIHNPTDKESVNQNAFNCIFPDAESGNIWLGTYGAGINIFNAGANKFDLIKHNPLNNNSLPSNFIWTMLETADSCLWIGTNDKGLCHYCPRSDSYTHFQHQRNNASSLSHNSVREVYQDREGIIWIGTDGGGLNRFNPDGNRFTRFVHRSNHPNSLSNNSVRVVFEDSKGRLWIGTRDGLNLFDRQSGSFERFKNDPDNKNSLSNNFVYASIMEDQNGHLWIGTYGGGLNRLNPETGEFVHYTNELEEGKRLSNNIVFSLYQDHKGQIWIGTNEGLNVLNPQTGEIKIYGMKDGLPNEVIYSILPDDTGQLWMSTNHGIACVNPKNMNCWNYDVSDGLQSNEFNGGAFHKGYSGRLYFGGVYGLNVLNPVALSVNNYVSKPVITRLEVLGNEVQTMSRLKDQTSAEAGGEQYTLSANISYTDRIELDYSQRFFAIEYSGLNYLYPSKTQYAFQLSPADKQWTKAGYRNYVSFADIKPGDYQFKVASTNSDGVWGEDITTLDIIIHPPFWQTSWFILLEIVLLSVFIVFIYRLLLKAKMNKLLQLQNEKISEANKRLQLSEENLRQMNVTKDKFFSIISHDLKNPFSSLMSISNMLDENYELTDDEDKRHGVKRINSSVKHIYNLLENLLTWSRSQRGKICFADKDFDLSTLIIENINLYKVTAQKKNLTLINNSTDGVMARGDRNTVNTIIRNLSGNAVKFTASGGSIRYEVQGFDGFWKVSVIDTGTGIDAEEQQHLFCIDKKLKKDGTEGEKGTGLGLIICKEFAEKNGGQIGVISEKGAGAEFWFTIRKGNS